MRRIFLENITEDEIIITGTSAYHLTYSLRARKGDRLIAVDDNNNSAVIELIDFDGYKIKTRRISSIKKIFSVRKLILANCLPKRKRFESIIEKTTELGVDKIIPLISERTVFNPKVIREEIKLERWKRIAKEASEQCGRDSIPKIETIQNLNSWLKDLSRLNTREHLLFFCYENETQMSIQNALNSYQDFENIESIFVLVGSEGGFTETEVIDIKNVGGISVSLGKNILKTDTAAISAVAIIQYELNKNMHPQNMDQIAIINKL